ncbi:MAG: ABC transporter permease [Candidatus Zixiibacteriota bacterium]
MKKLIFIFRESLRNAFESLMSNKLRSILTLLGIIIGVLTIISILSIINGFGSYVKNTFARLGTKVLYIQKRNWAGYESADKKRIEWWRFPGIGDKELAALEKSSLAAFVVPVIENRRQIGYGNNTTDETDIYASNHQLLSVRPLEIEEGRFFTKFENQNNTLVCVLGYTLYEEIFTKNNEVGIGKSIKIEDRHYKVIGYLKKMGRGLFAFGSDDDGTVYLPINTYKRHLDRDKYYNSIMVASYREEELGLLEEEIEMRLRFARGLKPSEHNNFGINKQEQIMQQYKETTRTLWAFIIGIGALSLLVAGIGVMNIMLISVSERTMEIGLRKAIGAKKYHILSQFLLEALIICWLGGFIGIVSGITITWLVSLFTPVPFALHYNAIYIGFGFTSIIGLFFGIFPAMRAAAKDPVDALRYE